jgi:hypothetical protein
VANIKVAIFRETYPGDKLTEDDQNSIMEVLGEVLRRTNRRTTRPEILQTGGRCSHLHMR